MLRRRDVHYISTKKNAAILFEPLVGILEYEMIFIANMFVAERSYLLRSRKEIKICEYLYSFHL